MWWLDRLHGILSGSFWIYFMCTSGKGPTDFFFFFWKGEVIGWIFCHIISPSKWIGQIAKWGGCKHCEASCCCKGQRLHCEKPLHCSAFFQSQSGIEWNIFSTRKSLKCTLCSLFKSEMSELAMKCKLVATLSSFSVAACGGLSQPKECWLVPSILRPTENALVGSFAKWISQI